MKEDKGITLIALISMVILITILVSVTINYGYGVVETAKLQNFNYELQQIQGKVDTIYEKIKLGENDYLTLGKNITESAEAVKTLKEIKGIDYSTVSGDEYYIDDDTLYRYFTENDIKDTFEITSNPGDFIINFQTREVISVDGFKYEEVTYYTLNEMK